MKRLLVVDPICHSRAPTMRSWLGAANEILPKHFEEVEIWSMENELELPSVKFKKFRKLTRFWPVQCAFFRFSAARAYRKLSPEYRAETMIQCSGEHLPAADIRYIHFWNLEFIRIAKSKPKEMALSIKHRVFQFLAARIEKTCVKPGNTKEWWCVSEGIAEPIKRSTDESAIFQILPNSYDPNRFNLETRAKHRNSMREHYGFTPEESVFVFCSFGHFTRKGLPQAVETIARLREKKIGARLLVLGGTESALEEFKTSLRNASVSIEGTVFAGLVAEPEKHLSAADALFFPSHFEAFSLVEIEAAALGLRLYLTKHPGSEMIVRDGINGTILPWEVDGMVRVLESEIKSGKTKQEHAEMGRALSPTGFCEKLDTLYREAIKRKLEPKSD
ncbi:MAG: glycosyltransferase [Akkermansiaceae bacterium]